jgi:hypothetical protein
MDVESVDIICGRALESFPYQMNYSVMGIPASYNILEKG